jgi:hypothetical protein
MWLVLADQFPPVAWANAAIALGGLCVAVLALLTARKSSRSAGEANRLAALALKIQEDQRRVQLLIKPRLMQIIDDGEDHRPRPVVEVVNLSASPVSIEKICWKVNGREKGWLYWKNPTISQPFNRLPARLPPREMLTAIGTPSSFQSLDDLRAITAVVVFTSCGERIAGMTEGWKEDVARLVRECANHATMSP